MTSCSLFAVFAGAALISIVPIQCVAFLVPVAAVCVLVT